MKKKAFTLAEVLITLGIIGIVAAMTMPALITNNRNKQFETGLKEAYSIISQASYQLTADTGINVSPLNFPQHTFKPAFIKYLKVIHDCNWGYDEKNACVVNLNKENNTSNLYYKKFNNKEKTDSLYFDDGQFIIANGMLFLIENASENILLVSVDLNGMNKLPNRWGEDLFTFEFTKDGKLLPVGAEGSTYTDLDEFCSISSNNRFNGIACTYKALTEKNYFKHLPK